LHPSEEVLIEAEKASDTALEVKGRIKSPPSVIPDWGGSIFWLNLCCSCTSSLAASSYPA
jgi:hypothetical protein